METIVADEDQPTVLSRAIRILEDSKHIKATVYADKELQYVSEQDAPGITEYRRQLESFFDGQRVHPLLHEDIISKLDQVAEMFQMLLIKTNMRIPYTSICFELGCGYWDAEPENRLRAAMGSKSQRSDVTQSNGRES